MKDFQEIKGMKRMKEPIGKESIRRKERNPKKLNRIYLFSAAGLFFFLLSGCSPRERVYLEKKDKNGFSYRTVQNDPMRIRVYRLKNGLRVYLRPFPEGISIKGRIIVGSGAVQDPPDATGLAHYLEHMMFKGSDRLGTSNRAAEKPLLRKIENLFEEKRKAPESEKKAVYARIDALSQKAAQYALPLELTQILKMLGASYNAMTSYDFTEYQTDFPSNSLSRWLELETERFRSNVLRLFHTELETVYEEFNSGQQNAMGRAVNKIFRILYKDSPYGRQTVIGKPEDLKNPSMKAIRKYREDYYRPSNMTLILSGNFDPDSAIRQIKKTLGQLPEKPEPHRIQYRRKSHPEATKPRKEEFTTPESPFLVMGFPFPGYRSKDFPYVVLTDLLLGLPGVGLFDTNILQKQKALQAGSSLYPTRDFTTHFLTGVPKKGQSLEQLKDLMLKQLKILKEGKFDESLIRSLLMNYKIAFLNETEDNRIGTLEGALQLGEDWKSRLDLFDRIGRISKKELRDFVRKNYGNDYALIYKRRGPDRELVRLERPKITPVPVRKEEHSPFYRELTARKIPPLDVRELKFGDPSFQKIMRKKKLSTGAEIYYIGNRKTDLFTLVYEFETGKRSQKDLSSALDFSSYLGTKKESVKQWKKKLFREGLTLHYSVGDRRTQIVVSGLRQKFPQALEYVKDYIFRLKPDKKVYLNYVRDTEESRSREKKDPGSLRSALINYGLYGEDSPFKTRIPSKVLRDKDPAVLLQGLRELWGSPVSVVYSGKDSFSSVEKALEKQGPVLDRTHVRPLQKRRLLPVEKTEIFFLNYDLPQARIILLSDKEPFSMEGAGFRSLYNNFFSSLLFHELRDSRGLVYGTGSFYGKADDRDEPLVLYTTASTNSDKVTDTIALLLKLINDPPDFKEGFSQARKSVLNSLIRSSYEHRRAGIYSYIRHLEDLGLSADPVREYSRQIKEMTPERFRAEFLKKISGAPIRILILGSRKDIDLKQLKKWGRVKILRTRDIFGD